MDPADLFFRIHVGRCCEGGAVSVRAAWVFETIGDFVAGWLVGREEAESLHDLEKILFNHGVLVFARHES